ncbi:MAG: carbohydrate ABC transporter permease [Eubacteriales bacterium]
MKRADRTKRERAANAAIFIAMIFICVVLLIPYIFMLNSSLKPTASKVFVYDPWIAGGLRFENYADVFKDWNFFMLLKNTLIVVVSSMVLSLVSSTLVAYGFARIRAKGKKLLFTFMLATMMLPWVVTLMPSYILYTELGWTGTFLPLILPAVGGGAFNIFLLRQYFMGIPKSLDEAAIIDGCSRIGVLFRIIVPNAAPIFATLIVFSFNGAWSDYVGPSIYLMGMETKYTLSVGLTQLKNKAGATGEIEWHKIMAACVMFALPMVVVLFSAQNAFTRGIVTSGIKD